MYSIREIEMADLRKGFLESLDSLRIASDLDHDKASEILAGILTNPDHKIFVAESDGMIVGSITLIIEQKFIHKGGKSGHIEDFVVTNKMQKKGIGSALVKYALDYARKHGCYKTILYCTDDIVKIHERLGFTKTSNAMRFDH